jgi:hypothetical protein
VSPVRLVPTLLVATAVWACPAVAGRLPAPNFKGKTAQGLPVKWTLEGHTMSYFEGIGRDTCGRKWATNILKIRVGSDGRFRSTSTIPEQAHVRVSGRIVGPRASGSFESDQNGCRIGPEKFSAHRIR